MERLVEKYIQNNGFVYEKNYLKQIDLLGAIKKWNLDVQINFLPKKKFDFVIFNPEGRIFVLETNFYSSRGGSKISEIIRSYQLLYSELIKYKILRFIWITDGAGWKNNKRRLEEAFEEMPNTIFNLSELKEGKIFN